MEATCECLLNELQIIWDDIGESGEEKDRHLLELEKECLEVYRRRVDQANKNRAQLREAIADAEAELAIICSSMGERPLHIRQAENSDGNLKAELNAILPQIEEMRKRKSDRRNHFTKILEEMVRIKTQLFSSKIHAPIDVVVDESDLSLRRLEELQRELQELEKEKTERLNTLLGNLNYLSSCCSVLGLDYSQTVSEVHPSLLESEQPKNVNNDTMGKVENTIQKLRLLKIHRMQQLQDLATSLLEIWNLMDTPAEEQRMFQKATCNIAASEDEITEPNLLSTDFIISVKDEVSRLEELKIFKMKELVLKKKEELENLCREMHFVLEPNCSVDVAQEAIESGAVPASTALAQFELRISEVKEEALRRKEILEKVEKWMAACKEESWLEEYNQDDNRYNAGRGAHLTLKRAEKARALVNKLPAMENALASKTSAWENEHGVYFMYDGVRLLSMIDSYKVLRQEKEQEQKRQREQKKLQGQKISEQEILFGSKPSPMKNQVAKKGSRFSCGGAGDKTPSLGGPALPSAKANLTTLDAKRNEIKGDDGLEAISSGRRGLDLEICSAKQHSLILQDGGEVESPMTRKPLSLISSTESSASIITNLLEDQKKKRDVYQKLRQNTTPSKEASSSPSTETEYSFEEMRAAFHLPAGMP